MYVCIYLYGYSQRRVVRERNQMKERKRKKRTKKKKLFLFFLSVDYFIRCFLLNIQRLEIAFCFLQSGLIERGEEEEKSQKHADRRQCLGCVLCLVLVAGKTEKKYYEYNRDDRSFALI